MEQIVCDKCKKVIMTRAYHLESDLVLDGRYWTIDLCARCMKELKSYWLKEKNNEQSYFDGTID